MESVGKAGGREVVADCAVVCMTNYNTIKVADSFISCCFFF